MKPIAKLVFKGRWPRPVCYSDGRKAFACMGPKCCNYGTWCDKSVAAIKNAGLCVPTLGVR